MTDAPPTLASTTLPVLVADLDHSLIASDLLHETFWSTVAQSWAAPFRALAALSRGRSQLKAMLAENAHIEVESLPYSPEVIALLRDWRARGGKTVLATASDARLAEAVAAHLGLFDEVHATRPGHNLKGEAKAKLLVDLYGEGGFDYIGDSRADLKVWRRARRAITVGAPADLRAEAERGTATHGVPALHLPAPAERGGRAILKAVRPHQWLKNLLIFLPLLAAHDLRPESLIPALWGFVAFSLIASSVYLLNDLLDLSADRAHPRKRLRPFASGTMRIETGTYLMPLLLMTGLGLGWLVGPMFALSLGIYYLLTLAYSLELKRRSIIDICALAVLYTLRVVAGGAATGIPISVWLLAFSLFFFFSLASVKRQAELVDGVKSGRTKVSGRDYLTDDLPIISMLAITSGFVSVLVMALYVTSDQVTTYYSAPEMLWAICLVLLYWISRVVLITHRGGMHDDPVIFAAKDTNSRFCAVAILGFGLAGSLL